MTEARFTRRRALMMMAAAVGASAKSGRCDSSSMTYEWQGTALGADARLVLLGRDRRSAEEAMATCLDEVERLERLFSLHRDDARIARLNATGRLADPPAELVQILDQCRWLNHVTEGLFDPTVQPLWRASADWYSAHPDQAMPTPMLSAVQSLIGFRRVLVEPRLVQLPTGTEITLNGIAQGYITDRIADLLRARGWTSVLVDLGEIRAIGGRDDGNAFDILLRESGHHIALRNRALATSAPDALVFAPGGGRSHILHPAVPESTSPWRCITVEHAEASIADGLSTALVLAQPHTITRIVHRTGGGRVWATRRDGRQLMFGDASRV